MTLIAQTVALEMIGDIRPLIERISRHDRSLANQVRRSASSVALNIGEASYSRGGNQTARFQDAMGSANETRAALKIAQAWGYIGGKAVSEVDAQLDRVIGLLWGLTRKRHRTG